MLSFSVKEGCRAALGEWLVGGQGIEPSEEAGIGLLLLGEAMLEGGELFASAHPRRPAAGRSITL